MKVDFSNARTRLIKEYKSISGLKIDPNGEWAVFFEMYREQFCGKLEAMGFTSDADYERILMTMDTYESPGEFVNGLRGQDDEKSAFGLIMFDRILRADSKNMRHIDLFCMHLDLMDCSRFADLELLDKIADEDRKSFLSSAGKLGAASRHNAINQLKSWALERALEMRGSPVGIARKLIRQIPVHLEGVSDNPERVITETLRSASKPK